MLIHQILIFSFLALLQTANAKDQNDSVIGVRPFDYKAALSYLKQGKPELFDKELRVGRQEGYPVRSVKLAADVLEKKALLSEVSEDVLDRPEVQLYAADHLAQGWRNGRYEGDVSQIRELALKYLNEGGVLGARAWIVIGMVGNEGNIALLESLAQSSNYNVYRRALHALNSLCLPAARAAVDRVLKKSDNVDKSQFVNEFRPHTDLLCANNSRPDVRKLNSSQK